MDVSNKYGYNNIARCGGELHDRGVAQIVSGPDALHLVAAVGFHGVHALYAYGADGKLVKVAPELWSITDETGAAVTELTDGVLYELRVTVADGGDFDLSETEKEIKLSVVLGKKWVLRGCCTFPPKRPK